MTPTVRSLLAVVVVAIAPAAIAVRGVQQGNPVLAAYGLAAEKAELLHAIYDRMTIAGRKIVSVRLTPSAYAHGLALALPEKVAMARPTGLEPATFGSGTQRSIH